ncbi:hypothetical protein HYH03_012627 [Edaphochlamys debaryana]|uniref:Glutathione S-transferase n=1 Tax=Edaphochlamys debaryana TaxID=47281 RepID=A0A835XTP8_9CHLO|nr:hypothetical protein HYH03_012627 [Edaphochlamys debaryana]|eukprot:KAG2488828.1 hypothetical protein HYH03_012627 [Edaphochlamys debaryana]
MATPAYKLHYFAGPGRAEAARLLFAIGNVPFEDVHYTYETLAAFKPKAPFGQVPVLELADGKMLAQSGAIDRYVAKLAGLYPEDPLDAARADMVAFHMVDFMDLFMPTWSMAPEERAKARQAILEGKGKDKLLSLSKIIEEAEAAGGWVAGGKMSYADVIVYVYLSGIVSKRMEGVPPNLLDSYPVLKAFRNKVAKLPPVLAFYTQHAGEDRASFRPDDE